MSTDRRTPDIPLGKHLEDVQPVLKDAMALLVEAPDIRVLGGSLG